MRDRASPIIIASPSGKLGEGGSIFLQDALERGMSFGKVAGFFAQNRGCAGESES
jgi:hypothetical protein